MSRRIRPPAEEIHKKEIVGRRAFGHDKDVFLKNDPVQHYKLGVFLEKRPGDVSVDRLGVGQCEEKRIEFLDPLGREMGRNRGKVFRGWAQFPVAVFRGYTKKTDPVGEANPFHAEILRDGFPTEDAKITLAYTMCLKASAMDFVPSPTSEGGAVQGGETG